MEYEYTCEKCLKEWTEEQKITEDAIKICKFCNLPSAKRLISKSSFILKGGGWAKDNYK